MKVTKREKKIVVSICLLLTIVSVSLFLFFSNTKNETERVEIEPLFYEEMDENVTEEVEHQNAEDDWVVVDIKGAVAHPGVYELKSGQRVIDVVKEAGGFLEEAEDEQINLAALLQDEMVILVPVVGDEQNSLIQETGASIGSLEEGKVDINHANASELATLPGIGPAKAEAIMTHREEYGSFRSIEDLLEVTGIGQKSLENLQESIIIK